MIRLVRSRRGTLLEGETAERSRQFDAKVAYRLSGASSQVQT